MHEKHEKTNAMRQLDRKKAAYTVHSYDGGALSGTEVAAALGPGALLQNARHRRQERRVLCLHDPRRG